MVRGLRAGLMLFSGVLLYITALQAAGAVVLHPIERTVCCVSVVPKAEPLSFPLELAGTTLRAEGTVYYEGPFLENGTQEPVTGALALLVRNTGSEALQTAQITLVGKQGTYRFQGCHIPSGAQVLLLETTGAAWNRDAVLSYEAEALPEPPDLLQQGALEIRDVDMGTVAVTNRTDQTLRDLHLYYKNYLSDSDLYQGGICYEEGIESLEPGQTLYLSPQRYAMGYSRFVRVEE